MKPILLFITFCLIGCEDSFDQRLSKAYVDNWIVETFPASNMDSNALYVLNGHLIDTDSIENKLRNYPQSDLIGIDYLDKATAENLVICAPPRGIVLLVTKGYQSKKAIRKNFSKVKTEFNQNTTEELPVLIVNGKQIKSSESESKLKSLRKAEIVGVNIIDRPVSSHLYGEKGKNGLVSISTK